MHLVDAAKRGRVRHVRGMSEARRRHQHPGQVPFHQIDGHVPDRIRLAQAELTLRGHPDPLEQIDEAEDLFLGHLGLSQAALAACFAGLADKCRG